jgi:3',5'-cyclic AMP phosphodiesterase CpdA
MADSGSRSEYEALAPILGELEIPWLPMLGNHDNAVNFLSVFGNPREMLAGLVPGALGIRHDPASEPGLQYAVDWGSLTFIALDTLSPADGEGGRLGSGRLAWLSRMLEETESPTVVIGMHHPPFATGIHSMDRIGLQNPEDFWRTLDDSPVKVQAVLCGHQHRTVSTSLRGVWAGICPSSAHQIVLDLEWAEHPLFAMEPPGFRVCIAEDGFFVAHVQAIGDYGPRYPFHEDGVLKI